MLIRIRKTNLEWWVVQDVLGLWPRPSGQRYALLSRFARLEPERSFSPARHVRTVSFDVLISIRKTNLEWWVVQDVLGLWPRPSGQRYALLSRFARLEPERSFSPARHVRTVSFDVLIRIRKTNLEWWVVQDVLGLWPRPSGQRYALLSRFARLEPERSFSPARRVRTVSFDVLIRIRKKNLEWWVVQDSNLRPID